MLDITADVGSGGEQGLLGLTFSPDGTEALRALHRPDGDTRVDEYTMTGTVDTGSRRELLFVEEPQPNHNGGQLRFGPDGMLYIGLGDGGGAGDPARARARRQRAVARHAARQDPAHRPDAVGRPAYTIPPDNPFVGGGGTSRDLGLRPAQPVAVLVRPRDRRPLDRRRRARTPGRRSTSSRRAGGRHRTSAGTASRAHAFQGDAPPDAVPPILEYPHDGGLLGHGGYVYRGSKIPALTGAYLYTDYCDGTVKALVEEDGTSPTGATSARRTRSPRSARTADGELYVLSQADGLQRIDPALAATATVGRARRRPGG